MAPTQKQLQNMILSLAPRNSNNEDKDGWLKKLLKGAQDVATGGADKVEEAGEKVEDLTNEFTDYWGEMGGLAKDWAWGASPSVDQYALNRSSNTRNPGGRNVLNSIPSRNNTRNPGGRAVLNQQDNSFQIAEDARFNRLRPENNIRTGAPPEITAPVDPNADILAKIEGILGGVQGTPDRWVSPYSQNFLNELGGRLVNTGGEMSDLYRQSINDITSRNQAGVDRRADYSNTFMDELAKNASNIGVDYAQGADAKRLADSVAHLDEVARQNTATTSGFFEGMADTTQNNMALLGQMAREGLLTPKQFVKGSDPSLSDIDKFRLGMLQDQLDSGGLDPLEEEFLTMDKELQNKMLFEEFKNNLTAGPDVSAEITESFNNPEFEQFLGTVAEPQVKDLLQSYYNLGGQDPTQALKLLEQDARDNTSAAFDPETFDTSLLPDTQAWDNPLTSDKLRRFIASKYDPTLAQSDADNELLNMVRNLLMQYSYGPTVDEQNITTRR